MFRNLIIATFVFVLAWSAAAEQDPRDQYGTQSLDAASASFW